MDLVIACLGCGQKNRCPRVDVKIRCGKCKTVINVLQIVAQYAHLLESIAGKLRALGPDERPDDEFVEYVDEALTRAGFDTKSEDEDEDPGDEPDEE
ncbi:MAG: hypothetical protein IMZ71_01880 [Chloroflexi bacterium]|nr:hypothetical protein [Chloroflexota bacterium]